MRSTTRRSEIGDRDACLCLSYRVLFHDTMAYGTHHFLTNLKFQCLAREHYYFGHVLEQSAEGQAVHDNQVLLTREAYSLNLAPVSVGERVAILMTIEEGGERTARMCFRVIHEDGRPVAAGYQTLVRVARENETLLDMPEWMARAAEDIREPLTKDASTFVSILHAGQTGAIFDDDAFALAREAHQGDAPSDGSVLGTTRARLQIVQTAPPTPIARVLLMPGQGSYDPARLRDFADGKGSAASAQHLAEADAIGRELLGASLFDVIRAPTREEHDARIRRCPDLAQVGMYILSVVVAAELGARGFAADAVAGHSFGEIAALTVAGVTSIADGARVVCARAIALREIGVAGGMLAILASEDRVRMLLEPLPRESVSIAVVNHDEQIVVAGSFGALEAIERAAKRAEITTRRVASPFPFHHRRLAPAVERFAKRIAGIARRRPNLSVFSPLEGGFLDPDQVSAAYPEMIARQLVTPLVWPNAVRALYDAGAREMIECGGGSVLTALVKRVLGDKRDLSVSAPLARAVPLQDALASMFKTSNVQMNQGEEPIAIIGLGCVLPNARTPDQLWQAILAGISGISDAGALNPELEVDFKGGTPTAPVADKAYSLLGGFIHDFEPIASAGLWGTESAPSKVQGYLAEAIAQARGNLIAEAKRTLIAVGSTADGSQDYDLTLLRDDLRARIERLDASLDERADLRRRVDAIVGASALAADLSPHAAYVEVAARLFGRDATPQVIAVDAACASSLYAVSVGVQALRAGTADLAYCGGVFSVAPSNACLFSQFGGLSATGSRPLDDAADGVIFGDGSSIVALRRLRDAVANGDPIVAVIRGVGTSSDGRGPSVAVPQVGGQVKAIERAWAQASCDPASADFVEAHATSTPVGDGVEVQAITTAFASTRTKRARPIAIGSLKALTGHVGWAAGTASLIKACEALATKTIPPQASFATSEVLRAGDHFYVPTKAEAWPEPVDGGPRRAGVNGFGFGGSNAHVVLEEHRAHDAISGSTYRASVSASARARVAIVGIGHRLAGEKAILPAGRPILPDVLEEMDPSHFLAIAAAGDALPKGWERYRESLGVVMGLEGKTARAIQSNSRLYRDRLRRMLATDADATPSLTRALFDQLETLPASGPYTLPGQMANVAAGRVANFFDLTGPNFVVDAGAESFAQALVLSARNVVDGSCRMMIAGGVSALPQRSDGAAIAVTLTSEALAKEAGLSILAILEIGNAEDTGHAVLEPETEVDLGGAHGARTFVEAVRRAQIGGDLTIAWPQTQIRIAHAGATPTPQEDPLPPLLLTELVLEDAPRSAKGRAEIPLRRVLVIADDRAEVMKALPDCEVTFVGSSSDASSLEWTIDLRDDESARRSFDGRNPDDFEAIIVVRTPLAVDETLALDTSTELLFVVARWAYASIEAGRLAVGTVCVDGLNADGELRPVTGLLGGFVKALARELPRGTCRALVVGQMDISSAWRELSCELSEGPAPQAAEAVLRGGKRYRHALRERAALPGAAVGAPMLADDEVVLATGGGRGVVAVLLDALRESQRIRSSSSDEAVPKMRPRRSWRWTTLPSMRTRQSSIARSERPMLPSR